MNKCIVESCYKSVLLHYSFCARHMVWIAEYWGKTNYSRNWDDGEPEKAIMAIKEYFRKHPEEALEL